MWGHEESVRILLREQLERSTEKGNVQSKKVLRGRVMEDKVILTARATSC